MDITLSRVSKVAGLCGRESPCRRCQRCTESVAVCGYCDLTNCGGPAAGEQLCGERTASTLHCCGCCSDTGTQSRDVPCCLLNTAASLSDRKINNSETVHSYPRDLHCHQTNTSQSWIMVHGNKIDTPTLMCYRR